MRDFDKEWERMRKRHDRLGRFVLGWIGFVAVLILTVIGFTIYLGATLEPEDVGRFFGRIVSGFEETAQ